MLFYVVSLRTFNCSFVYYQILKAKYTVFCKAVPYYDGISWSDTDLKDGHLIICGRLKKIKTNKKWLFNYAYFWEDRCYGFETFDHRPPTNAPQHPVLRIPQQTAITGKNQPIHISINFQTTVHKCLKKHSESITVNLTMTTMATVGIWFFLFVHTTTCLWFFIGSYEDQKAPNSSWMHSSMILTIYIAFPHIGLIWIIDKFCVIGSPIFMPAF